MPRAVASRGSWMTTGLPSKRTSPLSMVLMPAKHFTRVDLPAPLSPTSAVTSPGYTSKSTSCRTWTGPKLLLSRRAVRIGSVTVPPLPGRSRFGAGWSGRRRGRPGRDPAAHAQTSTLRAGLLLDVQIRAGGLDALADLSLRQGTGVDHVGDIRLGDDLRRQEQRLDLVVGRLRVSEVGQLHACGGRVFAGDQSDRELGGGVGLELDVLEDRHALLSVDDVLQTHGAGVLTGDGDLAVETVGLEDPDHGVGDVVVRREHAVDLATGRGQRLVERGCGVGDEPALHGLLGDDVGVAAVEHLVGALLEQHGVVVDVGAAVHHDDLRAVDALRAQAVEQGLRLELADVLVVEGDVVRRGATEVDAVVVDDLDAGLVGGLLDTGTRGSVDGVDDQDLDALADHVLRDRCELVLVTLGVLHVGGDAGGLEGLGEQRCVVLRVAGRRGRVRQDHPDLAAGLPEVDRLGHRGATGGRVVQLARGRDGAGAVRGSRAAAAAVTGAARGQAECRRDSEDSDRSCGPAHSAAPFQSVGTTGAPPYLVYVPCANISAKGRGG